MECKALSQLAEKFAGLDTEVFGISTDNAASQGKFIAKEMLEIQLLADPDKKMITALGALSPRGFASRYTYVIDKKGVIRKVYTSVTPAKHAAEVAEYVGTELK